jgi:hypothetical protein
VASVGALLAGACSDGGGGDPALPLTSNAFGDGRTIASLFDATLGRLPNEQEAVRVTGVRVVHVDTFDETGRGQVGNVYLQDASQPPGPGRAVLAFDPVYAPPSYRAVAGDVIDAEGPFLLFPRGDPGRLLPELSGAKLQARFDAVGGPLEPVEVPVTDFTSFETGKKWLSTLVTVTNVRVLSLENLRPSGRASIQLDAGVGLEPINLPTINNELFDLGNAGLRLNEGQTIKRVTGLVTLFRNFSISPRSAADIEL